MKKPVALQLHAFFQGLLKCKKRGKETEHFRSSSSSSFPSSLCSVPQFFCHSMIEIPSSFHAFFCDHTFSPLLLEGPFRLMTVLVINLAHLAHHKTRNIENRLYFMSGKIFGHYCTLDNEPPHLFFQHFYRILTFPRRFFCKVY